MPAHPTEACYCHVVASGVKNLKRLAEGSDRSAIETEIWHIEAVNEILTDYLLRNGEGSQGETGIHDKYWDEIRPKYLGEATSESALEHYIGWDFLALATRFEIKAKLKEEGDALRARINSNG